MAKAIMVQGTMSDVGKSVLVTALCRIFTQDGYKVAPFKSQNMASNSHITPLGFELGQAQAMQAEAARIAPSPDMNPILLKATSDMGSQVILNGKMIGTMPAIEYFKQKKSLIPHIKEAYERLAEQSDIVVIEGAGSPAELNLKENDIVNMGLAKMLNVPVLLVGDIDRGGIFATLYGTIALLEQEEQALVKGTIINKFRGDKEILKPGLDTIEELTKVPVLGVVPSFELDLADEDNLSGRLISRSAGIIDIAVIRFPHLSNFNDFNPLEQAEEVGIRYVAGPKELGTPDLLILPGSGNVLADLQWLKESGLEKQIHHLECQNTPILGMCGGYQMMGQQIIDTTGTEHQGLGLLPVVTNMTEETISRQCVGNIINGTIDFPNLKEKQYQGYELHFGETELLPSARPFTETEVNGKKVINGATYKNAFGTYVHGIFDKAEVTQAFLESIFVAKGLPMDFTVIDYDLYRDREYDKLADIVRANLDMEVIYEILGKS